MAYVTIKKGDQTARVSSKAVAHLSDRGWVLADQPSRGSGRDAQPEQRGPIAEASDEQLGDYNVAELEEYASELEVSKAGPKAELVARLVEKRAENAGAGAGA